MNQSPAADNVHPVDNLVPRVRDLCDQIDSEPLFHLSLHSKELFHSNLLAWFADTYPQAAYAVFSRWAEVRPGAPHMRAGRELRHLDLVIQLGDLQPLVIENKVFALPDSAQLEGIVASHLGKLVDPSLILLSLLDPGWDAGILRCPPRHVWHHVSYAELADALDEVVPSLATSPGADGFGTDVVRHYVRLIRLLDQLMTLVEPQGGEDRIALGPEVLRLLSNLRLDSPAGKRRAQLAISAARGKSGDAVNDRPITYVASLTRRLPLAEAFVSLPTGDKLGWQYQQGQFRLAVKVPTGNLYGSGTAVQHRREAHVLDHYAKWFDFAALLEVVPEAEGDVPRIEAAGGLHRFNPDFAYRYRKVPDLTFRQLAEVSARYLDIAGAWPVP
jgi:hypothetical protein